MIYALTALGGFVIGLTGAEGAQANTAVIASNTIFAIVGFSISGAIAKHHRFKHLARVALVLWGVSLLNIPLLGGTIIHWLIGIFWIFAWMGLGGALSYAFVRTPKSEEIPDYAAGQVTATKLVHKMKYVIFAVQIVISVSLGCILGGQILLWSKLVFGVEISGIFGVLTILAITYGFMITTEWIITKLLGLETVRLKRW